MKALAAKAVSELLKNSESKKFSSPCLSPRTPYILAPRSVYAFTLLPLSRHSIKWRYSIFSDLRNYLQNFVFIRGNLTFIFPCEPSVNRPTVYGLLVKKSFLWAIFRLETFIATSFDKERTFRIRYGLRDIASKDRRECMDWCRIDVSEELCRYVATERDGRSVTT
ncbi:hypothetical protein IGI04_036864 [Brassica rapa subsp. trilocularis]|uniref:Uncharacterized protein n=1 Tax=Brassica rapa subsp. trilocularis TaxID=1813537 RepID=A0ABQ7LIQ1_BRACM|nr:hypothetical protein IGI04_036864 [Brassica rapa subsp. trilocularis]